MKKIVLLGPPGCGKGTQSKYLVQNFNFIQISTGDLLRIEIDNKESILGKKIKQIITKGELVPDDIVINLIIKEIKDKKTFSMVFDGFPRNLQQAIVLDKSLNVISTKLNHAIFFEVDLGILEDRIKKRINESSIKEKRVDDNIETLLTRIEVYKKNTIPIIEYYEKKSILSRVNGMKPINEVSEKIKNIIT